MSAPRHAILLALTLAIAACSSRRSPPREDSRLQPTGTSDEQGGAAGGAVAPPPYTVIEVADGGNIVGHVRWNGARPPMQPLRVTKSPEICGQTVPFPALVIGPDAGVQGTVVFLDGITRGRALPRVAADAAPVVDQVRCQYLPHVWAVGVGQPIAFRNSDDTLHNVHAFWGQSDSWFNLAQPTRGMTTRKTAEHAGIARIVCDAGHTWMLGYVHVLPHPYFAVTDASGAFRIEGVPPGQYTLKAWHEQWRVTGTSAGRVVFGDAVTLQQSVTVAAGQDATAEFQLTSGSGS